MNGNELLQRSQDWTPWFDPEFCTYFSKEWFDTLHLSMRNFFSANFNGTHILLELLVCLSLRFVIMSLTRPHTVNPLKKDIKHLNLKLSELQALLERKEAQLNYNVSSFTDASTEKTKNSSSILNEESVLISKDTQETCSLATPQIDEAELSHARVVAAPLGSQPKLSISKSGYDSSSPSDLQGRDSGISDSSLLLQDSHDVDNGRESHVEELPEVKVDFQETLMGHTSPISCCRFSASGINIASASVDGTVRIWTYDSSTSASRNATIYCGAEILSLDWECKSERLLLIGTADGGIEAWNVDAKRVVCDLNTTESFPRFILKYLLRVCSTFCVVSIHLPLLFFLLQCFGHKVQPCRTNFCFCSSIKETVLPLGKDPPAITSSCFNHNGKVLAAAAIDGMIHMFDMSAGLQITGWPAHDSAISSILFGPDETSIFSLGLDGKIFEWSLQNQGQVLWSRNCNRFCDPESSKHCRHEMVLDANGRRLLVTSGSVRAPIYQVRSNTNGLKTLPHTAAITTVDWHPTLPIFLTGSADNSVRVTSIL
ncbi:hypothetical protein UlMin_044185 [Ulmus minor]